jgi:hypothetical protein
MPNVKQQTSAHYCPACGPVPPSATSSYCRHHTAQLWTSYLALRAARSTDLAVAS